MSEQTQAERLAEVLEGHQMRGGIFLRDGKWMVRCKCGEYLTEAGFYPAQDIALAAHQAAVVLAHLEAQGWAQGREEWGYRYWSSEVTGFTSRAKAEDHIAKNAPNRLEPIEGMPDYPLEAVLIRRRVTPWEHVDPKPTEFTGHRVIGADE